MYHYSLHNMMIDETQLKYDGEKLFRLAQLMEQRGRGRMIAKVKKMFELLSRKYSLLSSLLFSYLNNYNEECEWVQ